MFANQSCTGSTRSHHKKNRLLSKKISGPNRTQIMQSTLSIYMSESRALSEQKKIRESMNTLYHAIRLFPRLISEDAIVPIVSKIVEHLRADAKLTYEKHAKQNAFSCQMCHGFLIDPITLVCGHTFCTACIRKSPTTCNTCKYKFDVSELRSTNVNILISSLTQKLWPHELKSYELRRKGNAVLSQDQILAETYYTDAINKAPNDHVLYSNRSCAYHMMGRYEDALHDTEMAIHLRPDWAKGYYRKAVVLIEYEKWEEALVALLVCVSLEGHKEALGLQDKITSVLIKCLQIYANRENQALAKPDAVDSNTVERVASSKTVSNQTHIDLDDPLSSTVLEEFAEETILIDRILESFDHSVQNILESKVVYDRMPPKGIVSVSEFECSLCYHYLWNAVSTPCGHVFCRSCLDRSLDHAPYCPLCKSSLELYLSERRSAVTEFVDCCFKELFPKEYELSRQKQQVELAELAKAGTDAHHEIPIFVATVALPSIACPLHVFEARYRLMIRRCMEAGTREFGMCAPDSQSVNGYSDYGTMLEIREIDYTTDGRAILNTIGGRRFKCQSKSVKDGYNTAFVEFIADEENNLEVEQLQEWHNQIYKVATDWFASLPTDKRRHIMQHYGPMPSVERNYWKKPLGPAWIWWVVAILPLDKKVQLRVLKEVVLHVRIELVSRILKCVLGHADRR